MTKFNSNFLVDCYDGELMEPIVYHGHTMTVPILFRDILIAIESEAFTLSPYVNRIESN